MSKQPKKLNWNCTIAQFQDGPYDGQRLEMKYQQTEYYADGNSNGKYVKTRTVTPDGHAFVWRWEA